LNRFCYVCEKGQDPKQTVCELCSYSGGAYKPTDKKGKWAHGICGSWIPDLYEKHSEKDPPTWQTQHLDKRRFNLKCGLCKLKGACVQCAYGRCATAVHPWCALRTPNGYTRRIIKQEDGDVRWEIFCKAHAKSVSDPIKPKSAKHKPMQSSTMNNTTTSSSLFEESEDYWEEEPFLPSPKKFTAARRQGIHNSSNNNHSSNSYEEFTMDVSAALHTLSDDEDDEDDFGDDEGKQTGLASAFKEQSATTFPILKLSEWPGMSEGEGMDLDHFWNYVSSYFAEDHTKEVS
jgi:hypothetical protein